MWKTTGKKPQALNEQPDQPEELKYLWDWYMELRGDGYISYQEIQAWSEMTKQPVQAWEVDMLKTLDRLYWGAVNG